jgi:hypothetical protein
MRSTTLLALLAPALLAPAPPASAEPLSEAELRVGYGLAFSGSGASAGARSTPLTMTATGSIAISDLPPLAAFGGVVLEALDRAAAGATAGVRFTSGRLRLAGGGTAIVAPRTLWGAMASGGACRRASAQVELCGDLELTAFIAGSDLAPGRSVTQVQAVLAVVIDVL